MRLGDRDRSLGQLERDGHGRSAERRREPEVSEAGDLQVRAPHPARRCERFLEVSTAVVQAQRPELGDAEIHESGSPQVVVGHHGLRLRLQRLLQTLGLLEDGAEITASTGERERRLGHR